MPYYTMYIVLPGGSEFIDPFIVDTVDPALIEIHQKNDICRIIHAGSEIGKKNFINTLSSLAT